MDNIEVKLDEVEEKITSLITEKFSKNPPGVGGMDKETAKAAKSFYTEQAKAAEALRKSAEEQRTFMEKIQHEATASFMRNVGIPGVHGAGGAEEDSGYKPKGFSGETGIMAQLKSAITKQLPESIQVGIAGGLAAGGIMALVSIIGDAISNSKILTTILGTIGQALGLLIDVILLPFLPILVTGIIWLYQGIMQFYKLWSTTVKTLGDALNKLTAALGTSSVGGIGSTAAGLALGGGLITTVAAAILTGLGAAILASPALAALALVVVGALTAAIIVVLTPLAYKLGQVVGKMVYDAGYQFGGLVVSAGKAFGTFLSGIPTTISNALNGIGKTISDFFSNLGTMIVNAITSGINSSVGKIGGGAVNDVGNWLTGAENTIGGVASSAAAAVTNVFNFPNYVGSKADITKAVNDANRQQQYRHQA